MAVMVVIGGRVFEAHSAVECHGMSEVYPPQQQQPVRGMPDVAPGGLVCSMSYCSPLIISCLTTSSSSHPSVDLLLLVFSAVDDAALGGWTRMISSA